MRLGLSQAAYRWAAYPGLRIDQRHYGFRGMPYPYGTTTVGPAGLHDQTDWWIERCLEWGLDSLYMVPLWFDDETACARFGERSRAHGIEWIGSTSAAWAVDHDEWPAVRAAVERDLRWLHAGGVKLAAATASANPPAPAGATEPPHYAGNLAARGLRTHGGLRFGHFSTETPIDVQIERMLRNFSDVVRLAEDLGIVLAFENHMDYRIREIVQVVEGVGSPWLRINYDFANCYAVVEDQVDAAHMAAPYTVMTHLKDMRVQSITTTGEPQFFHAPVGYGSVEIAEIMEILQQHAPDPDSLPHCIETCCLPQYDPQLWMKLTIEWLEANCATYFPKRFATAPA